MTESVMSVMLVTANIGSIFEETVTTYQPKFVAVHCQEVGGKNYEDSMQHVQQFLRMLLSDEALSCYDRFRVFLDEDFTCSDKFTINLSCLVFLRIFVNFDNLSQALGNLYFIHEQISEIHLWDFNAQSFVPVCDKQVHSGNIETVSTKEKQKFPQEFFPEVINLYGLSIIVLVNASSTDILNAINSQLAIVCKWSRKGFLRTRWNVNGTIFDLVNIHLFHDASNFEAMKSVNNSDVDYEPMESDNETIDSYESDDVDLSEHEDDGVMLSDSWKRIADIFSDCRPNSLPELVRNFSGVNPALNCNANNSVLDCFKKFITNDVIVYCALSWSDTAHAQGVKYVLLRQQLEIKYHTLFMNESENQVPFFIFGDFNFRLDTEGVVNRLTQQSVPSEKTVDKNGELSKLVYAENGNSDKRHFDKEVKLFSDVLHEFTINFPPSYPYSEDFNNPGSYMKTRCPAWCDRVLLSKNALHLVSSASSEDEIYYDLIGPEVCMGDHKIQPTGTCVIVTKSSHMIRSNSANFNVLKSCPELFTTSVSQNNLLKPPAPHLRFISHHSSSCEEWYDDLKILKRQNALDHSSIESLVSEPITFDDGHKVNHSSVVDDPILNNKNGNVEVGDNCCTNEDQLDEIDLHANGVSVRESVEKQDSDTDEMNRCNGKCCVSENVHSFNYSAMINVPGTPPDTDTVTRYVHVKRPGSPVRIFKETTV
ncbi:Type I inositol 1,4,5-trisphosphate 5-phosphatase [Nymphon striatum]|nr:Type I inositol 1,4,5-trisphosphate 5-phosphatase [Nymphon striatum]